MGREGKWTEEAEMRNVDKNWKKRKHLRRGKEWSGKTEMRRVKLCELELGR